MSSKYNAWFHSYKTANLHLMYVRSLWINKSLSTTCAQHTREVKNSSFNMFFFQLQMRVIHWFTECWTITDVVWHIDLHPINHQVQWGNSRFKVVLEPQTCSRLQVFVILYLLFWPAFNWRIFLEKKNSAVCLLKTKWQIYERLYFQRHTHIFSSNCNVQFQNSGSASFHQPLCI